MVQTWPSRPILAPSCCWMLASAMAMAMAMAMQVSVTVRPAAEAVVRERK